MRYNLTVICRTANRFRREGYSRSTAFVLAWRLSKASAQTSVAGTSYGNRQAVLAQLAAADPASVHVELHRERDNIFDHNAVVVVFAFGDVTVKAGYLPVRAAALIAPLMDAGQTVTAAFDRIVGGWLEGMNYGARVTLGI